MDGIALPQNDAMGQEWPLGARAHQSKCKSLVSALRHDGEAVVTQPLRRPVTSRRTRWRAEMRNTDTEERSSHDEISISVSLR
jgi:hypothetical protein